MNTSTTPRNKMTGFAMRGGIEFDKPLTKLEEFSVLFSLAHELQSKGQSEENKRFGEELGRSVLHNLIEYCNTDPAHIRKADPRTAEQIDADQDAAEWQATYASLLP